MPDGPPHSSEESALAKAIRSAAEIKVKKRLGEGATVLVVSGADGPIWRVSVPAIQSFLAADLNDAISDAERWREMLTRDE